MAYSLLVIEGQSPYWGAELEAFRYGGQNARGMYHIVLGISGSISNVTFIYYIYQLPSG